MNRRNLIQLVAVSLLPLPGLSLLGEEEAIWVSTQLDGQDVTNRLQVPFKWNTNIEVTYEASSSFAFNSSAIYLSEDDPHPLRVKDFMPVHCLTGDTIKVSWTLRVDEKFAFLSIHDPRFKESAAWSAAWTKHGFVELSPKEAMAL